MKYGHVTGTRKHRATQSAWFREIEAQTLATLDATWPHDTDPTRQEVTHDDTASDDNDDSDSMTTALTMTTAR